MIDKNGKEIKTGQIVKITGAYFKNDNGLFLVDRTPGVPNWSGNYCSLKRINRNGTLSKNNPIGSWPIHVFVNDWQKKIDAKNWNSEHAEIEVIEWDKWTHILEYFREQEREALGLVKWYEDNFGGDAPLAKTCKELAELWRRLAEGI